MKRKKGRSEQRCVQIENAMLSKRRARAWDAYASGANFEDPRVRVHDAYAWKCLALVSKESAKFTKPAFSGKIENWRQSFAIDAHASMGHLGQSTRTRDSEQPNQWGYAPKSQIDQAHHMRYCPEPQNDLCHYPHGVWAYPQECEQLSERNLLPKPQSESYCYDTNTNYGWEGNSNTPYAIHPKTSSMECAFNKFMQDYPPMPQDDPYCDEFDNSSSYAWEDQNQKAFDSSYSTYQEPSSLEQTFNLFMQNYPTSPPSFSCENSSSLDDASTQFPPRSILTTKFIPQFTKFIPCPQNITTTHPCPQNYSQPSSLELAFEQYLQISIDSWKEQETLCNKMDGYLEQARRNKESLSKEDEDQLVDEKEEVEKEDEEAPVSSKILMKKEVEEAFEPETAYPQKPLEVTKEHENSQPPQTFLNQKLSTLESVIEKYEEEMKKSWEE
ncbi:hypothetical protein AHAS_Ahas11G0147800 [Arachis hypogaea]